MRIALAQLNSNDDIQRNLQQVIGLVSEAAGKVALEKPELIIFPENSLYFRLDTKKSIHALELDSDVFKMLEDVAQKSQIALHLTTAFADQKHSETKFFNASILFRPGSKPEVLYHKIHLFDISLKDQKPIRESDVFLNGEKENIFEFNGLLFGSSICYDLRFSELYSHYAKKGVDVILVPSAFLVKTGLAHWEVLLRARAIESQCYVLAPAQSGRHSGKNHDHFRDTFGHTMAIDPWGQVLSLLDSEIGLIYLNLDKNEINSVREQIPMGSHRRL